MWIAREILAVRPELAPVLRGLIATLVRHGLAEETGGRGSYIYEVDERTFLPTELGEQVLGFYLEVGAGAEITDSAAGIAPEISEGATRPGSARKNKTRKRTRVEQ
jgi:hypothetical protein